mmetsp:Transcript_108766/g.242736  ORF Transcript_108766/g.242736 Transcript_108766/m.242736 type:complete len:202 (+) Transcript_108766:250-855(+)
MRKPPEHRRTLSAMPLSCNRDVMSLANSASRFSMRLLSMSSTSGSFQVSTQPRNGQAGGSMSCKEMGPRRGATAAGPPFRLKSASNGKAAFCPVPGKKPCQWSCSAAAPAPTEAKESHILGEARVAKARPVAKASTVKACGCPWVISGTIKTWFLQTGRVLMSTTAGSRLWRPHSWEPGVRKMTYRGISHVFFVAVCWQAP